MKVKMPDLNGKSFSVKNKKSIVLIGANGSGKTRMSVWIDKNNADLNIHRISAQKSLNMPKSVRPSDLEKAEEAFWYGDNNDNKEYLKMYGKYNLRWGNSPETHLLDDFDKLMVFLMTENYEKSIEFREKHKNGENDFDNETKMEKIKQIWEDVITHRTIKISAGKVEVFNKDDKNILYNGSEMSDGERAIFYFIGEVLSVKPNSLIIIDEPENHLHKSILIRLWDAIEKAREDCTFLYVTHNLDFACSRVDSSIIWVKNMIYNGCWDFEVLDEKEDYVPDQLMLEILGNRQNVLLIEGASNKSLDLKLYSQIFTDYNIIPLGSCQSVINATKTYNNINTQKLHRINVVGIIDRDRRSDEEVEALEKDNVYVTQVAEIENLFLLPEVIQCVAEILRMKNTSEIVENTKAKVIEFLKNHITDQAMLFTKKHYEKLLVQKLSQCAGTIEEYETAFLEDIKSINLKIFYEEYMKKLQGIINNKDYFAALKVINDKGLLAYTNLTNDFGWKKEQYIKQVIIFTGQNDEIGEKLRDIFRRYIPLPK